MMELFDRPLSFATHKATPHFKAIDQHACVCFADDMGLVATTGEAGDTESEQYAELFAQAPAMLKLLIDLRNSGASLADSEQRGRMYYILEKLGELE